MWRPVRCHIGESTKPPTSVPSYMGTIVTSQVTKQGSSITGTRVQLVIVRTDPRTRRDGNDSADELEPGYSMNPPR